MHGGGCACLFISLHPSPLFPPSLFYLLWPWHVLTISLSLCSAQNIRNCASSLSLQWCVHIPPAHPCKNVCVEFHLCFQIWSVAGQLYSSILCTRPVLHRIMVLLLWQPYSFFVIFAFVVLFVTIPFSWKHFLRDPFWSFSSHWSGFSRISPSSKWRSMLDNVVTNM